MNKIYFYDLIAYKVRHNQPVYWEEGMDDDELDNLNLNICNKCHCIEDTNNLNWLNVSGGGDFTPKEGEVVPQEVYDEYDCLCEQCYLSLITPSQ